MCVYIYGIANYVYMCVYVYIIPCFFLLLQNSCFYTFILHSKVAELITYNISSQIRYLLKELNDSFLYSFSTGDLFLVATIICYLGIITTPNRS